MNARDASRVDDSGVPQPDENSLRQQAVYRRLAPWVGVAPPAPDPHSPAERLFRRAIGALAQEEGRCEKIHGLESAPKLILSEGEAISDEDHAILRGWYATRDEPRWCPCQSLFGGRAGRHRGIDWAAPPGVSILSPAAGWAEYDPLGLDQKLGHQLFIFSEREGRPAFGILMAHLRDPLGVFPRRVKAAEAVAILGCSGVSLYEGKPNKHGKYDTHLHLEIVTPAGHVDPLSFLGLAPRNAGDARCFFPDAPLRLHTRFRHPLLAGSR